MKKRAFYSLFLVSILLLITVLTGCSVDNEAKQTSTETKVSTNNGETMVIVRQSDISGLDPHFSPDIAINNLVYETLVTRDQNMNIVPQLASEWKQLDELTWEFKLQQGIKFHDGATFDAEAVKKTFQRMLDPKLAAPQANDFAMVKEVEVVDTHTVKFHLKYPFSPLLSILSSVEGSILSPAVIDQHGNEKLQKMIGTGPFVHDSWITNDQFILAKNENYWGKKPMMSKVVFKIIPETATRISMVETGEAHVAEQIPVSSIDRIKSSSSMKLYRSESLGIEFIGFNNQKKPFDDVRVRQAISYAINKEAIISGVYNNSGKIAHAPIPSTMLSTTPDQNRYPYDLNKAKDLLKEAGYPNGFKTTIWTSDRKEMVDLAEVIQSQLKGVGIDLAVNVLEFTAFYDAINKGEQDMFINYWGNLTGDGDYNQFSLFHSSSFGPAGNRLFYSNPKVDQFLEQARSEMDESKRMDMYVETQKLEIEDAAMIPYRVQENLAAVSNSVEGYWIDPRGFTRLTEVSQK